MALADFQRAFELNSRYLPAILGYADLLWERGQRPEAEAAYRVVLDDFPPSLVPARVRQRLHRRRRGRAPVHPLDAQALSRKHQRQMTLSAAHL